MNFKYTIDITADPEEVFTALEWIPRGNESGGGFRVFFMGGRYLWREPGGKAQSFACTGMVLRGDGSTFYCDH